MDSVPASLATVKALEAHAHDAWSKYKSTCRMGGTPEQRAWAYKTARAAEHELWAARCDDAANT